MSSSPIVFESEAVSPGLNFMVVSPQMSPISQHGHPGDGGSLCQIKAVDQIAMIRGDNLAFELSRRSHLIFFNFKIALENCKFPDRFRRGEPLVNSVDHFLHEPLYRLEPSWIIRNGCAPICAQELGRFGRIQSNQSHQITLAFTVNERMTNQMVFLKHVLDQCRRNVLPS